MQRTTTPSINGGPMTSEHPPAPPPARVAVPVAIGTDIQSVGAVENAIRAHGRRYLERVFTADEVDSCGGATAEPSVLAPGLTARFCAKEAVIKLLRPTSVVPKWTEIEVVRQPGGWTELRLAGSAKSLAHDNGFQQLSLSLSHDGDLAIATVVGVGTSSVPAVSEGER